MSHRRTEKLPEKERSQNKILENLLNEIDTQILQLEKQKDNLKKLRCALEWKLT